MIFSPHTFIMAVIKCGADLLVTFSLNGWMKLVRPAPQWPPLLSPPDDMWFFFFRHCAGLCESMMVRLELIASRCGMWSGTRSPVCWFCWWGRNPGHRTSFTHNAPGGAVGLIHREGCDRKCPLLVSQTKRCWASLSAVFSVGFRTTHIIVKQVWILVSHRVFESHGHTNLISDHSMLTSSSCRDSCIHMWVKWLAWMKLTQLNVLLNIKSTYYFDIFNCS